MLADATHKVVVVLVVVVHVAIVGVDVPSVVGVRSILSTRPIVIRLSTPIKSL